MDDGFVGKIHPAQNGAIAQTTYVRTPHVPRIPFFQPVTKPQIEGFSRHWKIRQDACDTFSKSWKESFQPLEKYGTHFPMSGTKHSEKGRADVRQQPKGVAKLKSIEPLILTLRGKKVIFDADLAEAYGVETKRLNEQVKRNADRFPEDFMFQMTRKEWRNLKSQTVTSSLEDVENQLDRDNRPQIATGSQKHRAPQALPRVFTEHGAIMAASVLNSPKAVEMSVFVVRAFVKMRERLAANTEILRRLAEIDKTLLEHNEALSVIWEQLQPLLAPPDDPPKKHLGFDSHLNKPDSGE